MASHTKSAVSALLLRGFSSVTVQTLLFRELLIVFHGSELTFGLMLAVWLASGALGSVLLARLFEKLPSAEKFYSLVQLIFAASLPCAVAFIRLSRMLLGIPFADALDLPHTAAIIAIALPAAAASDGILFTLGFRLLGPLKIEGSKTSSSAKIYLLESLGVMAGGLCFTFVLLAAFDSFQIALLISTLNLISAWRLMSKKQNGPLRRALGVALFVSLAAWGLSPVLQKMALAGQWHKKNLIAYENSAFGNIAVTEEHGQYTVFYDGLPTLSIPSPDAYFTEDFVHIPMLLHGRAKNILFVGTAFGGLLQEALKYPLQRAVYVEIDPLFVGIISALDDPLIRRESRDPRVELVLADGRNFVRKTHERFDVILVNAGLPTSLTLNRYYTTEFYRELRRILNPDGVAVFKTWGALSAMSAELKSVNAMLLKTARGTFPHVEVVPGDGFNIFLCSSQKLVLDAKRMADAAKSLDIKTALISEAYLKLRLDPSYAEWFIRATEKYVQNAAANVDLRPSGSNEGLRLYYSQFSKKIPRLLGFKGINAGTLAAGIMLIFVFAGWRMRRKKTLGFILDATVFSTGFAAMALQICALFLFQIFLGYLYQWLAILTASFMAGASAGALSAYQKREPKGGLKKLIFAEIWVPVLAVAALGVTVAAFGHGEIPDAFLRWAFPMIAAISGFLVGIEFPLVYELKLSIKDTRSANNTNLAGHLYGIDLIGAAGGALLTPLLLIPGCGILSTALLVVLLKAGNSGLLFLFDIQDRTRR